MTTYRYTLIFEKLKDDSPDTLRAVKSAMLTELGWDIERAQAILTTLPCTCFETNEESESRKVALALASAGASITTSETPEETETTKSGAVVFELNLDEISDGTVKVLDDDRYNSLSLHSDELANKLDESRDAKLANKAAQAEIEKQAKIKLSSDIAVTNDAWKQQANGEVDVNKVLDLTSSKNVISASGNATKELNRNYQDEEKPQATEVSKEKSEVAKILVAPKLPEYNKELLQNTLLEHETFDVHKLPNKQQQATLTEHVSTRKIMNNSLIATVVAIVVILITYVITSSNQKDSSKQVTKQVTTFVETEKIKKSTQKALTDTTFSKFSGKIESQNLSFTLLANLIDKNIQDLELEIVPLVKQERNSETVILEKINLGHLNVKNSEENRFLAKGNVRIFLERGADKFRPIADVVISGQLNTETNSINVRILANKGFVELPDQSLYQIDQEAPESIQLFLDEKPNPRANKIAISKMPYFPTITKKVIV